MANIYIVLLVFAFVCECLAAYGWPADGTNWRLGWGGLAFYFAALIFGGVSGLR